MSEGLERITEMIFFCQTNIKLNLFLSQYKPIKAVEIFFSRLENILKLCIVWQILNDFSQMVF